MVIRDAEVWFRTEVSAANVIWPVTLMPHKKNENRTKTQIYAVKIQNKAYHFAVCYSPFMYPLSVWFYCCRMGTVLVFKPVIYIYI